ncbi:hypothetical protein FACS1894200_12310 [Spirochaetia bacterium]|nr:hypothetical protein FACS1894200_12310 [Spirochaetia bacterium]
MKRLVLTLCVLCVAAVGVYAKGAGDFRTTAANGVVTITRYRGNVKELVIPAVINGLPVTAIGDRAFWDCRSLTTVTIPSSVTAIGESAFEICSNLTTVTIPSSVTVIGVYAFVGCSSLTTVTIPPSVTDVGDGAFAVCSSLTTIIVDNRNHRYASMNGVLFEKDMQTIIAYPTGKNGSSYTIPSSVTTIGKGAFAGCSSLATVTIPSSVTTIEAYAFGDCSSLTTVTIPSSVTVIGDRAFKGCNLDAATRSEITRRFGNAPLEG